MGARRASGTAVVAVVGGVLLVTLLVTWAATIGPGEVLRGDGPTAQREEPTETPSPTDTASPGASTADLDDTDPGNVKVIAAIAIGLQLLLLGVFLFGAYHGARVVHDTLRGRSPRRGRRTPPPEEVEFDVLEQPAELVRELAGGAAAQRDLLASGSPRNAIVEVWNRFETLAASAGARRRPWETSSEFTLKVLAAADADSTAVARLAGLYREARFSDHELTEEHRAAAESALAAIHAALAAGPQVDR
jgi:uncharacterized protein DUF4129